MREERGRGRSRRDGTAWGGELVDARAHCQKARMPVQEVRAASGMLYLPWVTNMFLLGLDPQRQVKWTT